MKNKITGRKENKINRVLYAIVFLFAFALYINTAKHDYAFDDATVLLHAKKGLKNLPELLSSDLFSPVYGHSLDIGIRWRPLSVLISAIEYEIFGDNPFAGHLINILLYSMAGVLLFYFLSHILSQAQFLAFIATLIFIAHPIHTEVVANIKSRDEILSFIFLVFTLLFLHRFTVANQKKHIISSLSVYFMALLFKENGAVLLAVIPLFLYCFCHKNLKQGLLLTAPFLLILIIYLGLRASVFSGFIINDLNKDVIENQFYGISFLQKTATIAYIMGKYFLLLLFPHPLSCDYSYNQVPTIDWLNPKAIISALICTGLLLFAIKSVSGNKQNADVYSSSTKKRVHLSVQDINTKSILSFCIFFYFITISIVSNIFFNVGTAMAERFLFLPSMGFCLALAIVLLQVLKIKSWNKLRFPPSLYIFLGLLLVSYSYKTIDRNKDWKDDNTLFSKDVETVPNSAKIHYYYGGDILEQYTDHPNRHPSGKAELYKAIEEERRAIAIHPTFYLAYYTIGLIYEQLQMTDSAIYHFDKAVTIEPRYYAPYGKLGFLYGNIKGDADKSILYYQKGLEGNTDNALWGLQLGVVYGMKGMYKESIRIFEHARKIDQTLYNDCTLNIGTACLLSGNYREALNNFQLLLQRTPHDVFVIKKIAETYQAMGDTITAQHYFSRISK